MLKTNEKNVVEIILQCQPGQPRMMKGWEVDRHGKPFILPSIGGITLNIQIGDCVFGWEGDHVEPGVSCTADTTKPFEHPNVSLQLLSCVGNKARVIGGEAKGAEGRVLGTHGGSEHVIIDFPRDVKEKLTYEDKILITSRGQGLKLLDYPEIVTFNLDPELLAKMSIKELGGKKLQVPVTTIVPRRPAWVPELVQPRLPAVIMTSSPAIPNQTKNTVSRKSASVILSLYWITIIVLVVITTRVRSPSVKLSIAIVNSPVTARALPHS